MVNEVNVYSTFLDNQATQNAYKKKKDFIRFFLLIRQSYQNNHDILYHKY